METYLVNTSDQFTSTHLLQLWKVTMAWFEKHAGRYEIVCESGKKGSDRIIALLKQHASSWKEKPSTGSVKTVAAVLDSLFGRQYSPGVVFTGTVNESLIRILSLGPLPDDSVPADISPCQQVVFFRDTGKLFTCYDYGVFQTLYFRDQDEVNAFRQWLEAGEIPQEMIERQI